MMDNPATRALEIASAYRLRASAILKEKGKMPYGKVKATPKEQREEFNKLTPQDMQGLVQKHGKEAVNEYIREMMGGLNG